MVDTSLENTATVSVSPVKMNGGVRVSSSSTSREGIDDVRNLDTVSSNSVVDELVVLWRQVVQALLNDVVSIEICKAGSISLRPTANRRRERNKTHL